MTVGEVISALTICASNKDSFLMGREIYGITIKGDYIDISFVDSNTEDYSITINGEKINEWSR